MNEPKLPANSELPEPIAVALVVAAALDSLGVPYYVGGSLASALYGVSRATMDVDLVAGLRPEHAEPLAHSLTGQFYVDAQMIHEAISLRRSFNVIHLATMLKVDVFVSKASDYAQTQLKRRVSREVGAGRQVFFASAEDIVLAKMEWYRMGGQVSDRQWNDILGVLRIQGQRLDRGYLGRWAAELGISDLLARAFADADG